MIDLRNRNNGKKYIKHVLRNARQTNQPWTKENQNKQLKNQKNAYTRQNRPK